MNKIAISIFLLFSALATCATTADSSQAEQKKPARSAMLAKDFPVYKCVLNDLESRNFIKVFYGSGKPYVINFLDELHHWIIGLPDAALNAHTENCSTGTPSEMSKVSTEFLTASELQARLSILNDHGWTEPWQGTARSLDDLKSSTPSDEKKLQESPGSVDPVLSSPFTATPLADPTSPPLVKIKNASTHLLTLKIGNTEQKIASNESASFEIDPGSHVFLASSPGVRSLNGNEIFQSGYEYSWTFTVVTTRTRSRARRTR